MAVYGQTLSHGFINFDDPLYVTANPQVRAGLNLDSLGWAFVTDKAMYFHPLTWISHMLDCTLYGMCPWGHHLTSLLFHAAASVLLFLALKRLTGTLWPGAAVAALFAVHPLHVESVAWVAERKDVLSAFFWMLALDAYARYARLGGPVRYAAVVAAFVLGLMSKPMVVTLPFVLLLLDYWPLGRLDRTAPTGVLARQAGRLVAEKAPLFLLTALSCASTFVMQTQGDNLSYGAHVPFPARCANAVVVYALYLAKTVWPTGLAVFYPHPIMRPLWQVAVSAVLLAAVTVVCLRQARRRPYLVVGWLWYLGTLVPVIELVQAGKFSHADRYTYLPSIGVFIMVAWGVADLAALCRVPYRAVAAASCTVLALLSICAAIQASHWRDNETLFGHALAVGQESSHAYNILGGLDLDRGRPERARVLLEKALELDPENVNALNNLGKLAMDERRWQDAADHLQRALDLDPDYFNALFNMGVLCLSEGRFADAETWLAKALHQSPGHPDTLYNLGMAALKRERYGEAAAWLDRVLEQDPEHVNAMNNLGVCLIYQERFHEAEPILRKTLELDPRRVSAMTNLAGVLARLGQGEESRAWLDRANALKTRPTGNGK